MSAALKFPEIHEAEAPAPQSICARLKELAPLHQRAALKKAKALASKELPAEYTLPALNILELAENPPEKIWAIEYFKIPEKPCSLDIEIEAHRLLNDPKWLSGLVSMPRNENRRRALLEAEMRCWRRWKAALPKATELHTCINTAEHEHGRRLARKHRPLLDALGEILNGIGELIPHSMLAAMPEAELKELAKERAEEAKAQFRFEDIIRGLREDERTPEQMKLCCPRAQVRRLRTLAGHTRQHLAAALGTVGGRNGAWYADDYSLERWHEKQAAAREWENKRILKKGSSILAMKEVLAANRTSAIVRIGTICRGLDELAERNVLIPVMITLTLPSEFHPNPTLGERSWTPAISPKEIDNALRKIWIKFRARLAHEGIQLLGLRVWEPHKDSCPHVHALLYVEPEQREIINKHLQALRPEPGAGADDLPEPLDENGHRRGIASDFKTIDRTISRGSSYVVKYLVKSFNDEDRNEFSLETKGNTEDRHLEHYERHRATAAERNWRRFAFLGVHGITKIWQRLLTADAQDMRFAGLKARQIKKALTEKRWADALELLGAIRERGAKSSIRLGYRWMISEYGEERRQPVAITARDGWVLYLSKGWTCEVLDDEDRREEPKTNIEATEKQSLTVNISYPREGASHPPSEEEEEDDPGNEDGIWLAGPPPQGPPSLQKEDLSYTDDLFF